MHFRLPVKPICGNFKRVIQGVGRGGPASQIVCPVLAHPPATRFTWKFNNSLETVTVSLGSLRKVSQGPLCKVAAKFFWAQQPWSLKLTDSQT